MSRLGQNYIEVGQLTETILPMHDVRLIAVNDGVDSAKDEYYTKNFTILFCNEKSIQKRSKGTPFGNPYKL